MKVADERGFAVTVGRAPEIERAAGPEGVNAGEVRIEGGVKICAEVDGDGTGGLGHGRAAEELVGRVVAGSGFGIGGEGGEPITEGEQGERSDEKPDGHGTGV